VYVGVDGIENEFKIPMYGNRKMLRTEDRNAEKSQYYFLEKAGIRFPKQFEKPEQIDRLVLVKVQRADKPLERPFSTLIPPHSIISRPNFIPAKG